MTDNSDTASIPFSFVVSLVEHISRIAPRKANAHGHKGSPHSKSSVVQTFCNWVAELHRRYDPLPPGTTATVFRLLFPEEDAKRKYDMQEARLAQLLSSVLGVVGNGDSPAGRLASWKAESAIGCLGHEVRKIRDKNRRGPGHDLSIAEVDNLLSTLACKSAFSADSIREDVSSSTALKDRSQADIVHALYSRLSSSEACVVTQIILKDLRPLLYPLPEDETHYTALLLQYKSNSLEQLSKFDAMRVWDPSGRMLAAYRVRACLDEAALAFEKTVSTGGAGNPPLAPQIGTPIQIPKCSKGQGCAQSLRLLHSSKKVWAETKYDGERTQIHLDIEGDRPRITIYSKSGRNSTFDRIAIHPLILEAIGFGTLCKIKRSVVLEAEMVAYSDTLDRIDEFWRIRSLIGSTAVGPRHSRFLKQPAGEASQDVDEGSQCSLVSNASDDGMRHLALVFFDILVLDGMSLLSAPYSARRATLERLLHLKPGHTMLAERVAIDMRPTAAPGVPDPQARLRKVFAEIIANHQEGLVLKADEAPYNDWRMPWVKLKKDYIEGYGDTLDLVLVGAAWEKERARELRVAPTAYTTFYIGVLANAAALKTNPRCTPHFEVFFTASYGLSREELEQLNFRIKSSDPARCESGKAVHGLPYTYHMFKGLPSPAVLLPQPILAEVVGGSFTKATHSKFYELRFPRIVKVFRSSERSWTDGTTMEEFQQIARESVGHESSHKDVEDWCNELWGRPSSPGVKCPLKRLRTEADWAEKLEKADRKAGKRAKKTGAEYRIRSEVVGEQENPSGASPGSSRSPRLMRALGSVTNVMKWSHEVELPLQSESPENSGTFPSTPVSPPPTGKRLRDTGGQDTDSPPRVQPTATSHASASIDCSVNPHNVLQQTAANDLQDMPSITARTGADAATSRDKGEENDSASKDFTTTPLGRFLQDAVIWLAKPRSSPRPAWRVPSKLIFPPGQQVQSLESLLQACRWGTSQTACGCDWAEKGVVFVDDTTSESMERSWTEYPLKTLMERRSSLLHDSGLMISKPVWVFSTRILSYDVLSKPCADIESQALCRFG
ncbi:uncharacterized protein C8Q71DRAFT_745448 [Rhodofomes roseus]|uniref:ATP-dependent DNA ligase family profile domain-containing protein n=1 Tax=Rhodofomes roseus TaxID=34475 RepID=A0ABQ8KNN3_9APHY|nr:uncharacterized protein C8Q71DRAFT_745448 [Rhodofomes roseus]KAH9840015.1 hypothetical protein C8Q71DRAFT_745448 [Rhodofomes roseus]